MSEVRQTSKNYSFNDKGRFVDQDGCPFKFTNQSEYEKICEEVIGTIYSMMEGRPYFLRRISIKGEETVAKDDSFVFISLNFDEAESLVVLIHGTGAVRAGQWSRRLILNESLDDGSQLPYIRECLERGWAVLVMNTNDNTYRDEQSGEEREKRDSGTAIEHGLNVWRRFVKRSKAKKVAIVAHSYGGIVAGKILEAYGDNRQQGIPRIRAICLTDALFDVDDSLDFRYRPVVRNWICSDLPLNQPLDGNEGFHFSAGTEEHERSSAMAIGMVFDCISENFRKTR